MRFGTFDRSKNVIDALMSDSGRKGISDKFRNLQSIKNKEDQIKELRKLKNCLECKQSLINSSVKCCKHGGFDHFSKILAGDLYDDDLKATKKGVLSKNSSEAVDLDTSQLNDSSESASNAIDKDESVKKKKKRRKNKKKKKKGPK